MVRMDMMPNNKWRVDSPGLQPQCFDTAKQALEESRRLLALFGGYFYVNGLQTAQDSATSKPDAIEVGSRVAQFLFTPSTVERDGFTVERVWWVHPTTPKLAPYRRLLMRNRIGETIDCSERFVLIADQG